MFCQQSIEEYLNALASGAEVPGGGSASALAGALGAAAALMVNYFTVNPQKYAAVLPEIQALTASLEQARQELQQCIDDDARAFAGFGKVYAMPKNTPEEKAAREQAMQATLKEAMQTPLKVMTVAAGALRPLPRLAEIGNKNLITDTGVAAVLLQAAVRAARLNVLINLKFIKDRALQENVGIQVKALTEQADADAAAAAAKVESGL